LACRRCSRSDASTIDAAHEQLIVNESTQCKTPSGAALKEADETQAQVTEIMKAPMHSSKAQEPATPPAEAQKAVNAPPVHDLMPSPEGEPPVTPQPESDTAEAAAPAAPAPYKTPVAAPLLKIEDLPQYKFAREIEHSPVTGGSAESRYLTTVYGMIKAHLDETAALHVESANERGVASFYVDKGGNLVSRKLVSSSGSPSLDRAVITAIADAAPYPAPPKRRALYLNYNFGKR
jgi:periplasmic protein TonB